MSATTIDRMVAASCRRHPETIAFRSKINGRWNDTSYRKLQECYLKLAAGMVDEGFKPGQHAAIIAGPSYRWVVAYLATMHCGGVVVPIDKELKATELRHILKDSDSRVLFTESGYLDALHDVFGDLPRLEKVVLLDETFDDPEWQQEGPLKELLDAWGDLTREHQIPTERVRRIEKMAKKIFNQLCKIPTSDQSDPLNDLLSVDSRQLSTWIRKGRIQPWQQLLQSDVETESAAKPDGVAVILYTSGTTGQSKGAMLSHANLAFNIKAGIQHLGLTEGISTLSFLPINHVFEQVCGILLPLSIGGTIAFAESLKKIGDNLAEIKPTFLLGVPAVYRLLLDRIMKNIEAKPLSRLLFNFPLTRPIVQSKIKEKVGLKTVFVSGGAALDPAVAEGFKKLGLTLFQGYGITETSPIIAAESPDSQFPGSVGQPMPGVEVRIKDPNPEGVGEILVKGPNVMLGYYNHQTATEEAIVDGWYHTGDLGRLDDHGNLFISGRVKNLIVTANGKNVYPEEVENELLKSPYIAEIMVYGHQTSPTSEEVYAIIYPDQDALDSAGGKKSLNQEEIEAIIKKEVLEYGKNLADYKRIRRFTLREDEFPKTTTRKIKRFIVEPDIPAET